ncbi:MAG: hypothetical protein AB1384_00990 [Actinomycetota bacterium]
MRKTVMAIMLSAVVLSLMITAGCGNTETTETPSGHAEIDQGNDKTVINEGDESATLEQPTEAPGEDDLGAPIYPGAEYDAENSGIVSYSSGDASAFTGTARFITDDGFGDVVGWYRGRLGEPASATAETADWLLGEITSGDYTAVHVEKGDGVTRIDISHMAASLN